MYCKNVVEGSATDKQTINKKKQKQKDDIEFVIIYYIKWLETDYSIYRWGNGWSVLPTYDN